MIPQHLSNFTGHGSPPYIVEASRQVLGQIDLDPASSGESNEVVKALCYYAPPFDGLIRDWDGRVFLNPPGGSLVMTEKIRETLTEEQARKLSEQWGAERERWKTKSRAVAWWRKLTEEYLEGRSREAIFIGFSLDILEASQGEQDWPDILKFPICVPEKRIPFLSDGKVGTMPTHGNVIVYLPHKPGDSYKFEKVFREIGSVSI